MAGITIDDLMDFSQQWPDTADSWTQLLAAVESNVSYLQDSATVPLNSTWQGTAAELASGQVDTTHGGLITSASQLKQVSDTLTNFSSQLTGYSKQITLIVDDTRQQGFDVAEDGTVSFPGGSALGLLHQSVSSGSVTVIEQESARLEAQRQTLQSEIQAILAKANSLDDQTANDLAKLLPQAQTQTQSQTPAGGQVVTTTPWQSQDSSLWQIAQQEYGDGSKWNVIYEANRSVLGSNPNLIPVGVKLQIPPLPGTPSAAQVSAAVTGPAPLTTHVTQALGGSLGITSTPVHTASASAPLATSQET
jgi:hypothetical protein